MGLYGDWIFPKLADRALKHEIFDQFRGEELAQASGRILEIGIGTGLILDLYPEHVSGISAIDPNPGMERELRAKLKSRKLRVDFYRCGAEKMPFADETFDTVVSTLTICSIPDLPAAMGEVRRVLKNDGKFLFLEHGLSPDPWVSRIQRVLNPIQKIVGCGCSLTVNPRKTLEDGGFEFDKIDQAYFPKAPRFIAYGYRGIARKRRP